MNDFIIICCYLINKFKVKSCEKQNNQLFVIYDLTNNYTIIISQKKSKSTIIYCDLINKYLTVKK